MRNSTFSVGLRSLNSTSAMLFITLSTTDFCNCKPQRRAIENSEVEAELLSESCSCISGLRMTLDLYSQTSVKGYRIAAQAAQAAK